MHSGTLNGERSPLAAFPCLQLVLGDVDSYFDFKIVNIRKEQLQQNGVLPAWLEASEGKTGGARFVVYPPPRLDNNDNGDNRPQETQGHTMTILVAWCQK